MLQGKQTPTHPCGRLSRPPAGDPHSDQDRKALEAIRLQLFLNFGFSVSPPFLQRRMRAVSVEDVVMLCIKIWQLLDG